MRPSIDRYFIDMSRLVASRSTCVRRAVGCVLVDRRNHVLATGYNGVPAGQPHCNDVDVAAGVVYFPHACAGAGARSGQNLDACHAVHAEQNAVLQCPDAYAIKRAYVTAFPCPSCTKLLLNTSCEEIVYDQEYGDDAGRLLWIASGRLARAFDGEPPMLQKDLVELFGPDDPLNEWRVVVACVCLNVCSARVARGVVMRILERWPTPASLAMAGPDLEAILKPLGLSEKRAETLRGLYKAWGRMPLEKIPGVGPYAVESVLVFCRGEIPKRICDRKVAAWVAWKQNTEKP